MPSRKSSKLDGCAIVVIGASAGGFDALHRVLEGLPPGLPGALFVVLHTSARSPGVLPSLLNRVSALPAHFPKDHQRIACGLLHVAPPDHHLLVDYEKVRVTRGPRENGFRPAVDALFRTAARAYGPRVIGVVLSGALDDGTAGLLEIKKMGGLAIVQDPEEAAHPGMPQSALRQVKVDYVSRLSQLAALLTRLCAKVKRAPVPALRKRDVAEAGTDSEAVMEKQGPPSPLTCPECGGSLWEVDRVGVLRFRCHLGHSFTTEALEEQQALKVEAALWTAMRALEERAVLRERMANQARERNWVLPIETYDAQARDARERAAFLRSILMREHLPKQLEPLEAPAATATDNPKAASGNGDGKRIPRTRRRRSKR